MRAWSMRERARQAIRRGQAGIITASRSSGGASAPTAAIAAATGGGIARAGDFRAQMPQSRRARPFAIPQQQADFLERGVLDNFLDRIAAICELASIIELTRGLGDDHARRGDRGCSAARP